VEKKEAGEGEGGQNTRRGESGTSAKEHRGGYQKSRAGENRDKLAVTLFHLTVAGRRRLKPSCHVAIGEEGPIKKKRIKGER